jgi:hypothetical protein
MDGPQSRSGHSSCDNGNRTPVTLLTELSWLFNYMNQLMAEGATEKNAVMG